MGHYLKLHEPQGGVPRWQDDPHSTKKRWRVEFVNSLKDRGYVWWAKRLIRIRRRNHLDTFTTLLHELSHVGAPEVDEAAILRIDHNHIQGVILYLRQHGEELLEEIRGES